MEAGNEASSIGRDLECRPTPRGWSTSTTNRSPIRVASIWSSLKATVSGAVHEKVWVTFPASRRMVVETTVRSSPTVSSMSCDPSGSGCVQVQEPTIG